MAGEGLLRRTGDATQAQLTLDVGTLVIACDAMKAAQERHSLLITDAMSEIRVSNLDRQGHTAAGHVST